MSDSLSMLRRKIKGVRDLGSVVRTMKAMAAAAVGPCESALAALADYRRTVEFGLAACFRHVPHVAPLPRPRRGAPARIGAIVFGTDQGMVGQFNERLADFATAQLGSGSGSGSQTGASVLWVVGERMQGRLEDSGLEVAERFPTPNSVSGITPLISDLLLAIDRARGSTGLDEVHLFHNQPRQRAAYEPMSRRLLPLDEDWRRGIETTPWPSQALPGIIAGGPETTDALIREFLFVTIFATCAESVAAENARRFAAMQGAERNIAEQLDALTLASNRERQTAIDEELFDLVSGYEILRRKAASP